MLNLISDPWIPVYRREGRDVVVVRPAQIADLDVQDFAWPRPDLNLACHELLIGLTYLACPPKNEDARLSPPDQDAFQDALAPLAPAFNLLGDGPRFLQDIEPLDGDRKPPDMLFIDSSGVTKDTLKKNVDLMVRRDRYENLPLPLAAMALYTLQAFAPSGGGGNRTSIRGGGPMVTLVRPAGQGLWPLIWANVPRGKAHDYDELENALPWMRPTVTSENDEPVVPKADPDHDPEAEMFFGQPRRLQLLTTDDGNTVTGVIQRKHGANYEQWIHYLSPYYEDKDGQQRPVHPKPGSFGYRDWRGIILQSDKRKRPENLERYLDSEGAPRVDLIVAGWAMENAKPRDFLWSEQPVFPLSQDAEFSTKVMVEAAEQASFALALCVSEGMAEHKTTAGTANAAKQAFFNQTQSTFEDQVAKLSGGAPADPESWLDKLRQVALSIFDEYVLPGLFEMQETRRSNAISARKSLVGTFRGYGSRGKKIYQVLDIQLPPEPLKK